MDSNGSAACGVTSESFAYDGDDLALRFGNAGELTHRYQYGPAVDQALADETSKMVGGQRVGVAQAASPTPLFTPIGHSNNGIHVNQQWLFATSAINPWKLSD